MGEHDQAAAEVCSRAAMPLAVTYLRETAADMTEECSTLWREFRTHVSHWLIGGVV